MASERPRRTTKMLLDTFYGGSNASEDEKKTDDPTNLDGVSFNADSYTRKLLVSASLRQLLERERTLQTEIKELDGDMKTLVYENYNFIAATDTIRKMKENVSGMEHDMTELGQTMELAASCATRVDSSIAPRREKLRHLATVERLLRRLQFAVDLPSRLRKCVELGAFSEAVKYHSKTAALIEKHSHLPSFARIKVWTFFFTLIYSFRAECSTIMDGLKTTLHGRIHVTSLPAPPSQPTTSTQEAGKIDPTSTFPFREVAESATLLLSLGESEPKIREEFLTSHKIAFDALFAYASGPSMSNETLCVATRLTGAMFLVLLLRTFESYKNVFLAGVLVDDELKAEGDSWNSIIKFLNEVIDRYLRLVQKRISDQVQETPLPSSNSEQQQQQQQQQQNKRSKPSVTEVLQCLEAVQAPIAQVGRQLPFLSIVERASEVLGGTLLLFAEANFTSLIDVVSQQSIKRLEELCKSKSILQQSTSNASSNKPEGFDEFWMSASAHTFQELTDALDKVVSELQPLATAGGNRFLSSQVTRVCHKVHIKTQQFFLNLENLFSSFISINENPNDKQQSKLPFSPFLLTLCGVSKRIGARIERYSSKVARAFPTDADIPLIQVDDIKKRFENLSISLLDTYVALEGGQLSSFMHKYIGTANWLRSKEPRDVGLGANLFVERVSEIDMYLKPFFEESVSSSSASGSGSGSTFSFANSTSSSRSSPMFEKRPDAFGHVEFSRQAVISSIVRIGLKAMFECVRLYTFGRSGFQQLQVDKYFLQASLLGLIGPVRDVQSLLDDIEANAQQRCLDPVPMDLSVSAHILRHHQLTTSPVTTSPPL